MKNNLNSFEQLESWQKTQDLAVEIYKITKDFPDGEKFGITNQIRRAVASVSANIAEGFGRISTKEKQQFYSIAYGSLLEVKNFAYLANKLSFIDEICLNQIVEKSITCQKLINGLIRSTRNNA